MVDFWIRPIDACEKCGLGFVLVDIGVMVNQKFVITFHRKFFASNFMEDKRVDSGFLWVAAVELGL